MNAPINPTNFDDRAVRARRARLEADLIEEGASESTVLQLATDETAAKMIAYERQCIAAVREMFSGAGS